MQPGTFLQSAAVGLASRHFDDVERRAADRRAYVDKVGEEAAVEVRLVSDGVDGGLRRGSRRVSWATLCAQAATMSAAAF